jgi:hypothetical protein
MDSAALEEKRRAPRYDGEATIHWSFFNETSTHKGRILNFGPDGLYLETDELLNPGTTVWIWVEKRISAAAQIDSPRCLPSCIVAVCKWCKRVPEKTEYRYGTGLRYEFPML